MSKNIGTIQLSNKVIVSDPCYERGTWCAGVIENVLPGKYECFLEEIGGRNSAIEVRHSTASARKFEEAEFEVGVDSGQAGIFDDSIYPIDKEHQGEYGELDTFYGKACELTTDGDSAGLLDDKGFVSQSGYGDGGYRCSIGKDKNGKVVFIRVVFIEDDEPVEEEW